MRRILGLLLLASALAGCGRKVLAPERSLAQLERVRQAHAAGEWRRVRSLAGPLVKAHPLTTGSEEASFLAAQAEEKLGRPTAAFRRYQTLLLEHPASSLIREISRREFDLAAARHAQGKPRLKGHFMAFGPALHEVFDKAARHDPYAEHAAYALLLGATCLYDQGKHEEAEPFLARMLQDHPKTPWAAQAEFLRAMNHYRAYKGPSYDIDPLREAQEGFEGYLRRRPDGPDAEAAGRMLAVISDRWAQHALEAARIYRRLKRPEAEKLYYEHALEGSPDSPWAEEARHALGR